MLVVVLFVAVVVVVVANTTIAAAATFDDGTDHRVLRAGVHVSDVSVWMLKCCCSYTFFSLVVRVCGCIFLIKTHVAVTIRLKISVVTGLSIRGA